MKRTALASMALLAALTMAGCSAASTTGDYAFPDEASAPEVGGAESGTDGTDAGGEANQTIKGEVTPRSVVVTGYMTVVVDDPIASATEAVKVVEGVGGRIDGRKEYAPANGDQGSASLTLRIPTEFVDSTIDNLKELGTVEEISTNAEDVTSQVRDIASRIKALQASVDRLTALLASAGDVEVLVAIEASLSQRQSELESLLSQQRSIGDQVDLATITLSLTSIATPVEPEEEEPLNFFSGLALGWGSFTTFVAGTVAVLGVLLPWLVFFGLVAAGVVFAIRWRTRRAAQSS